MKILDMKVFFGPNKIAVIIETLTDNKNRTASNLRKIFKKMVEI